MAAVVAFEWLKTSALTGLHPDLPPFFLSPSEPPQYLVGDFSRVITWAAFRKWAGRLQD